MNAIASHTIIIQASQTLADIAVQEYGTVEGMVLILQANPGLSVSSELIPGAELIIPGTTIEKTQGTTTQAAPEPATAIQQIPIIESPVKSVSNYQAIKTITVQAGQTLADIALQEYGTVEGMILVLQANPGLSITDALAGGQELVIFTLKAINLVKELVKTEGFGSQLQSILMQWISLIKPDSPGVVTETDPVFQAWLETFEATTDFLSLTDVVPTSYAGKAKNVPIVTDAENGLDFMGTVLAKLTHLADFPATYVGQALKPTRVRADELGIEFYTPDFISGITKAMVEAVLTGLISSHTHDYLPTSVKQEIEINDTWKLGSNLYVENVFTGSDLTQVNYWSTAAKTLKLFTKDITYTGGNPTTIVLKDEVTAKLLTTTIAYTGTEVLNVTKVVS